MLRTILFISALAITPAFAADLAPKKSVEDSSKSTDTTTTESTTINKSKEMDQTGGHVSKSTTELHAASKLEKQMNKLMAEKDTLDAKIAALQAKIDAENGAVENK